MAKRTTDTTKDNAGVLDSDALYFGDNGTIRCGDCSAAVAQAGGTDLGGSQLVRLTRTDAIALRVATGDPAQCDNCGFRWYQGRPDFAPLVVQLTDALHAARCAERDGMTDDEREAASAAALDAAIDRCPLRCNAIDVTREELRQHVVERAHSLGL